MRRFFVDIPSLEIMEITLPPEESRHIAKVLRMKAGDCIELVNGKGELFIGEITQALPKHVSVKQVEFRRLKGDPYHMHIAIAPTKNNDRLEWFMEKATELGIHEITPVICSNSERKIIKPERFQKILVAAMKQSKRGYLPQLNSLISFADFVQSHPNGLIAHCYEEAERNATIRSFFKKTPQAWKDKNIPILIGPEGDFTLNEVETAMKNGYQAITLGKTRLRTETAGIYACASLKLFFEEEL